MAGRGGGGGPAPPGRAGAPPPTRPGPPPPPSPPPARAGALLSPRRPASARPRAIEEGALRRWSEWAMVAHEVGGALTPARNALDLVRGGTSGRLQPEQAHLLGIAARGLERAERVLQNLLALAAPDEYRAACCADVAPADLLGRLCE